MDALHAARKSTLEELGKLVPEEMAAVYRRLTLPQGAEEVVEGREIARRQLRNAALVFLSAPRDARAADLAFSHFSQAKCMTDRLAALNAIASIDCPQREEALAQFFKQAQGGPWYGNVVALEPLRDGREL